MPSLLSRGQSALLARLAESAAPDGVVTYYRPDTNGGGSCVLTGLVWVGKTKFPVSDRTGEAVGSRSKIRTATPPADGKTRFVWSDRDYLLKAADLVIDGSAVLPQVGDWFEEVFGDEATRVRVMPYESEPHYRYSDPQRTELRVHTKLWTPAE
jgi:hypothetical protein